MKTILTVVFLLFACAGYSQSFYARYHNFNGVGQTIKTKTIGQKIRTKIKYARKRHNSERFAFREMRRRSRAGQI